ncbi:MAG: hypothetical protein U0905_08740 [Pirellulales bacterium]
MSTPSNPLESLAKLIPGYSGHLQLEKRREDDRMMRAFLSRRLRECKTSLDRNLRALAEVNPLQGVAEGEKIRKSIHHIQNRLDSAVEGYASWFDQRVVDDELLKRVADTDAGLVGLVDRLHQAIDMKSKNGMDIVVVESLLSQMEQRIDKRHEILHGDR